MFVKCFTAVSCLVAMLVVPASCAFGPGLLPKSNESAVVTESKDGIRRLPAAAFGQVKIEFAEFFFDQNFFVDRDYLQREGVQLDVSLPYAFNQHEVLIYGSLRVPLGPARSIILRTRDGGKSWQEVIAPVEMEKIQEIFFLADGIGWAVSVRTNEAIEGVTLYKTLNYGQEWEQVGMLPNHGYGAYSTFDLRFVDILQGEIWAEDDAVDEDGSVQGRVYCRCTTADGGETWHWTNNCYKDEMITHRSGLQWSGIFTATDGSQWRVLNDRLDLGEKWIKVQRRMPGMPQPWATAAVIPKFYSCSQVMSPEACSGKNASLGADRP